MNIAIPAVGMQESISAFEQAAKGISRAFTAAGPNPPGARSNTADSADLNISAVSLLAAKDSFLANVKTAQVDNEIIQNTFSIIG